jgi:transposase-like protein
MSVLSRPYFYDEAAAFEFVESIIWPTGPVCHHCGCTGRITTVKANAEKRIRMGLKRCGDCKGQFTVRMGTIFEESKLPMTKWLQAIHLMCSSKKGVSAHQLHRTLETTYKTAWFLAHRIREAMRSGDLAPFGQGGGDVEVDETYFTRDHRFSNFANSNMKPVVTLIDRSTGRARSIVVDNATSKEVGKVVADNIAREARLLTDASGIYKKVGQQFAAHQWVNHSKDEYVSKFDPTVHTNTVEGFYSIFKRGMKGVYQHCSPKHLHRYVAEFDFRYSNRIAVGVDDSARTRAALAGVVGKRLTYRGPDSRSEGAAL